MRRIPHTSRLLAAAATLACFPLSQAAAQSCLGFSLQPNQKSVSTTIDERGELGGIGATLSIVTKSNDSFSAQITKHEVDLGNAEFKMMYLWSASAARPVFRSRPWGSHKSGNGGTCVVAELGGMSFEGTSSNFVGGGLGYGLQVNRFAVYGAPLLGIAFAEEASDSYLNVRLGGSARLGPVFIGLETTAPLAPDGAQGWSTVRLGFAWGRATQIPASHRPGTSEAPSQGAASLQSAAAPINGNVSGPTAGLKPYAVDDIEAMIKNSVSASRILDLSRRACLSFRVDDASETRLRRVGAGPELLSGLRQSCYSAS